MITISHESADINIHRSLASSSLTSTGNIPYGWLSIFKEKQGWLSSQDDFEHGSYEHSEFKLHMSGIVLGLGDLSNT